MVAWCPLWLFGGNAVWYWVCGLELHWKYSSFIGFKVICYTIWGLSLPFVLACVWSLLSHLRRLWSLRTLDASFVTCFVKCLLKVKQRFKHGGVIGVIYAWVILAFEIHSWGLICLILWFTPLISLLRLVFAYFSLISDWNLLSPSV